MNRRTSSSVKVLAKLACCPGSKSSIRATTGEGVKGPPAISNSPIQRLISCVQLNVVSVELVGLLVLHNPRHFGAECFAVSGAPQQMETHLHPGGDAAGRGNLRESVQRHHAGG